MNASGAVTPAAAKTCSSVALRWSVSHWTQKPASAARIAAATDAAWSAGKCSAHACTHSPSRSTACQGVSVPPQSKITARTVTSLNLVRRRGNRLAVLDPVGRAGAQHLGRARGEGGAGKGLRDRRRGDPCDQPDRHRLPGHRRQRGQYLGVDGAAGADRELGDELLAIRAYEHDLCREVARFVS